MAKLSDISELAVAIILQFLNSIDLGCVAQVSQAIFGRGLIEDAVREQVANVYSKFLVIKLDNVRMLPGVLYISEVKSIIAALSAAQPIDSPGFWVSTLWVSSAKKYFEARSLPSLDSFLYGTTSKKTKPSKQKLKSHARKLVQSESAAFPSLSMTSDLLCVHGRPAPTNTAKSKKRLMSSKAWHFLRRTFYKGPAIRSSDDACSQCASSVGTTRGLCQDERNELKTLRKLLLVPESLERLFSRKNGIPSSLASSLFEAGLDIDIDIAADADTDTVMRCARESRGRPPVLLEGPSCVVGIEHSDDAIVSMSSPEIIPPVPAAPAAASAVLVGPEGSPTTPLAQTTERTESSEGTATPPVAACSPGHPSASRSSATPVGMNWSRAVQTSSPTKVPAPTPTPSQPSYDYYSSMSVGEGEGWDEEQEALDLALAMSLSASLDAQEAAAAAAAAAACWEDDSALLSCGDNEWAARECASSAGVSLSLASVAADTSSTAIDAIGESNARATFVDFEFPADRTLGSRGPVTATVTQPLVPGIYHVVPRSWLKAWRQLAKNADTAISGNLLPLDCTGLLCGLHGNLIVPPHLEEYLAGFRRNLLGNASEYPRTAEMVEIVSAAEWDELQAMLRVHFSAASGCDFNIRFCLDGYNVIWNVPLCRFCDPFNYHTVVVAAGGGAELSARRGPNSQQRK